jgi:hypothetical protein
MRLLAFLFSLIIFTACNATKASKVKVINNNNHPITFVITTLNKIYSCDVAAKQTHEGLFTWTDITKADGDYKIKVTHPSGADEYNTGYYTNGELSNYLNFTVNGDQVVADISE